MLVMRRMISRELKGWRRYAVSIRPSCLAWMLLLPLLFFNGVISAQDAPAEKATATAAVDDATGNTNLAAEVVADSRKKTY